LRKVIHDKYWLFVCPQLRTALSLWFNKISVKIQNKLKLEKKN